MGNLICKGDRALWEYERKQRRLVTASLVAQLLPGYQYTFRGEPSPTPYEVWLQLTGRADRFQGSEFTEAGHHFQDANRLWLQRRTYLLTKPAYDELYVSDRYPWLGASPDGYVEAAGIPPVGKPVYYQAPQNEGPSDAVLSTTGLLELKNVSASGLSKWNEPEPPRHYWAQVQLQLLVCGYTWGVLAAKVDSAKLRWYYIEEDPVFQDWLVDITRRFYTMIETDEWRDDWMEAAAV